MIVGGMVSLPRVPPAVDNSSMHLDVLVALINIFSAEDARIYELDLSTGYYVSPGSFRARESEMSFDAREVRQASKHDLTARAVAEKVPMSSSESTGTDSRLRIVLPAIREETAVALVDVRGASAQAVRAGNRARTQRRISLQLRQVADMHEAAVVHRVLEHTARFKVDLYRDEDTTISNLMKFVAESCGMQYVALRRLEANDSLRSIESHGFGRGRTDDLSFLNFSRDYVPFAWVVEQKDHWRARDLKGEEYKTIRDSPELKDVKSFVACPVLLGEEIWGVLSFAAAVEYDYSGLEVYALRVLANLTGVALEAARNADTAAEDTFDDARLMQSGLANEVVVATRHEMDEWLEVVGAARSSLLEILEPLEDPNRGTRLTRAEVEEATKSAESLDRAHEEMNKIMGAIRISQQDLVRKRDQVNVQEVWDRAIETFNFRINRSRVRKIVPDLPPRLTIVGSADWLRIVFMHLIINSLDAFDRDYMKDRREIGLRVEGEDKGSIRLRYYDNAGGIIPGSLQRRGKPVLGEDPIGKLIFQRFVSSKAKGTGLGLASCREGLATMNGSIELVDWHRGVTFEITLEKWRGK